MHLNVSSIQDQFLYLGNRARVRYLELQYLFELQIDSRLGISCLFLLTSRSTTIEHQLKFLVPRIMRVYRARCHTELDDSRAQYTQGHTCLPGGKAHQYRARKRSIFTVKIEEQNKKKTDFLRLPMKNTILSFIQIMYFFLSFLSFLRRQVYLSAKEIYQQNFSFIVETS